MTAPKKKATAKVVEPRQKSLLAVAGDEAQRKLLLKTLKNNGWNLTHTAEALKLAGASHVIRSLKTLGLADEYAAAKADGRIAAGRPR